MSRMALRDLPDQLAREFCNLIYVNCAITFPAPPGLQWASSFALVWSMDNDVWDSKGSEIIPSEPYHVWASFCFGHVSIVVLIAVIQANNLRSTPSASFYRNTWRGSKTPVPIPPIWVLARGDSPRSIEEWAATHQPLHTSKPKCCNDCHRKFCDPVEESRDQMIKA